MTPEPNFLNELRELSANLVKHGLRNDDMQAVFIGNALATIIDSSKDSATRIELSNLLSSHVVKKIQRKAGLTDTQMLLHDVLTFTSPN